MKVKQIGRTKVFQIFCPGCKLNHNINTNPEFHGAWKITEKDEKNFTVSPELKINFGKGKICKFNITQGNIIYSKECFHQYAGKEVPLQEIKNTL